MRPEKIALGRRRPTAERARAARSRVARFLGVSIQYVVDTAGGEELTVFAQNADAGRGGARAGAAASSSAVEPEHTFVVAGDAAVEDSA